MLPLKSKIFASALLMSAQPCFAEANPVEMDAAVARMASAAYKVEVLSACGMPSSAKEKEAAAVLAMIMVLQRDDLIAKLSKEQFLSARSRATETSLAAGYTSRAKAEATAEECAKQENKALWEHLAKAAKSVQ